MHIRAAKIIYALDWYGQTRGPGFNEMEHHSGNSNFCLKRLTATMASHLRLYNLYLPKAVYNFRRKMIFSLP